MRVALFVTCLADLFRPSVAFATIRLLETAGCTVEVPTRQTCCGQPAYNNGDLCDARKIALNVIASFAGYPYVVVPSGSCAGMLKKHYPALFTHDPELHRRALDLAERTYELTSFLVDVMKLDNLSASFTDKVTYHDSCSSLRELGIQSQPRQLLQQVKGLEFLESGGNEQCCGFGGTFCVKFPDISARMARDKVEHLVNSGANIVLAADLGCLLNITGMIKRQGIPLRVYHIAEVLAGMHDQPGIGDAPSP